MWWWDDRRWSGLSEISKNTGGDGLATPQLTVALSNCLVKIGLIFNPILRFSQPISSTHKSSTDLRPSPSTSMCKALDDIEIHLSATEYRPDLRNSKDFE